MTIMAQFIYLFRGEEQDSRALSPEQMEQSFKKWMGWMDELRGQVHLKPGGQRLAPEGRVVKGAAKAISDGPFVEAKDTIGGFILVEAETIEQAVELSHGCPALEHGGSVEVRPLMVM